MKNHLPLLLVALFMYSCMVPKIELTEEEKRLEESLKEELNCPDFEIRHDYYAISENKKDGELAVSLCDSYCSIDSTALTKIVKTSAKQIEPQLSHRENYKSIAFYTSVEKHIDKITTKLTCQRKLTVLLEQPDKLFVE